MTTTTNRKSFYATTYITQGETEFKCSWDLMGEADNATAITHLTDPVSYTHLTLPTTPYV